MTRALHHTATYRSFDLTECRINRIIDGDKVRVMISWPKKWTEVKPGEGGGLTFYDVTEWEEAELELIK
jgi:hypothetical protein